MVGSDINFVDPEAGLQNVNSGALYDQLQELRRALAERDSQLEQAQQKLFQAESDLGSSKANVAMYKSQMHELQGLVDAGSHAHPALLVQAKNARDVGIVPIEKVEILKPSPDTSETNDEVPSSQSSSFNEDGEKKTHERSVSKESAVTDDDKLDMFDADAESRISHSNLNTHFNKMVLKGSAYGLPLLWRFLVWTIALGGVIFVLLAWSFKVGADVSSSSSLSSGSSSSAGADASSAAPHRLLLENGYLVRRLGAGASPLLMNIAFSVTGAGLIAIFVNFLGLPLILGYLLGGVLVGPAMGLHLVESHEDIAQISSLGLIFLLFMIGLELDVKELLKMGKVVLCTGALQFPICAGVMIGIFTILNNAGISFGNGPYAVMYTGMVCAISSTMIVVKLLSEKGETESRPGRLTIGILIFQDIWAIIVLAIQPNMANPEILDILKTFGMIGVLIAVAMSYAKFVMPAVLVYASKSVELMLVLALAWCFFICCFATLPFIGLSMELAALIAGVALAAFPYGAEFNGKIKYIRDFFITLFFVALGMQIPPPTLGAIGKGMLVASVVLMIRWLGIFMIVKVFGGGTRLGAISTINLSQISEFALVICKLGQDFGHVDEETMTIIIWTFAILAVLASYLIGHNSTIYSRVAGKVNALRGVKPDAKQSDHHFLGDHEEKDIVLLGFHRVAFQLLAEFVTQTPQMLKRLHVVDVDSNIMPKLKAKGVQCSYGDITSADVLEHAYHGEPRLVISTIPDSLLHGASNMRILRAAKQVWPNAHYIVTADNPKQAYQLYEAGAHYVIRMAKLCAERLHGLLAEQMVHGLATGGELATIFDHYRSRDREKKGASTVLDMKLWK